MQAGALTLQLIDEDGEDLPGSWSFEWTGRDPLELSLYVITALSAKPWKWTSQRVGHARLSPARCRAMSARVGKLLRKENRPRTVSAIAQIVASETLRPGQTPPPVEPIAKILTGTREPDWDAGPAESTPAMLRAFRQALRAAVECEGGLDIIWGERDE